ncbi:NAD(+) synthase [soil metagenome]
MVISTGGEMTMMRLDYPRDLLHDCHNVAEETRKEHRMSLADAIATWIADQIRAAGQTGAVVGLSGGIDSAVVSGLCARAMGKENVLGVILPSHSTRQDVDDARLTADTWGISATEIDLSDLYDRFLEALPPGNALANANVKPRLRMICLYHHANTLRRLVVGTGNKSELMIGYFTKYGDGGVDLLPIGSLYKHQVRDLAREIGVPEPIITKAPSAGLWAGQTDEDEMGMSYEALDQALQALKTGDTSGIDDTVLTKVRRMVETTAHKRQLAPVFVPPSA